MTKYEIVLTSKFKKDYKLAKKQNLNIELLNKTIYILSQGQKLPEKYKDHSLAGNWKGHRECHIQPNWLLIYKIDDGKLVLTLSRTGSHSDLFKM